MNSKLRDRVARRLLKHVKSFGARRLIVFLTPGYDWRVGGILSIVAIHRESAALRHIHNARVALCTVPGDPRLDRYTWFKNRIHILNLEALLERCRRLDYLLIHIPEYAVNRVRDWLGSSPAVLRNVEALRLNVMVQNIDLIKGQDISGLKRFGKVTCTTAHEAYTNLATRAAVGVSLHRLGILRGAELYSVSGYAEKDPLLMVSHDAHPLKEFVSLADAEVV